MQILTVRQVKYCHLIINKSDKTVYVIGLSFQNKLFVRDRVFTYSNRQKAIQYCQTIYLANKGRKFYLLLKEAVGFTVWIEDKSARVIGSKSPEDVMHELRLSDPVAKLQNIGTIDIGDRNVFIDSVAGENLIELEISLHRAISLGQKLMN